MKRLIVKERQEDEGLERAEQHVESGQIKVDNSDPPRKPIFKKKIEESEKMDPRPPYWQRKNKKLYESQRKQRRGLWIEKDYALVRCNVSKGRYSHGCHGLMVVENGQGRATCPRCGRRRWLVDTVVIEKSDSEEELNDLLNEMGGKSDKLSQKRGGVV